MPRKSQESPGKLGRGKPTSKVVRICPVCKKPALRLADSISGWMTAEIYLCNNCGYRGSLYIEVDVDEYERSQIEESRKPTDKESSEE